MTEPLMTFTHLKRYYIFIITLYFNYGKYGDQVGFSSRAPSMGNIMVRYVSREKVFRLHVAMFMDSLLVAITS